MKIVFFSDIHGVPSTVEKLLDHADRLKADQLVILGDISLSRSAQRHPRVLRSAESCRFAQRPPGTNTRGARQLRCRGRPDDAEVSHHGRLCRTCDRQTPFFPYPRPLVECGKSAVNSRWNHPGSRSHPYPGRPDAGMRYKNIQSRLDLATQTADSAVIRIF